MDEQRLAAIEARFAAGHVGQTAHHCNYCGGLVPELVAEVRRLRELESCLYHECAQCGLLIPDAP